MGNSKEKRPQGMSLIEVLSVIAIIGILVTITFSSMDEHRAKGRDTARAADLESINLTLMRYYEACRGYPASLDAFANNGCPSGTTLGTFIASIPTDPLGDTYSYSTSGAGAGHDAYVVRAELETNHAVLADDIDGSSHDGVALGCDDSPQYYYCLGS